jgi:toxin ParE1/3/4
VARTIKWTEAATADLAATAEFIARDSVFYATALVREARTAALSLRFFADRGRRVPEGNDPTVRELFLKELPPHLPGHAKHCSHSCLYSRCP